MNSKCLDTTLIYGGVSHIFKFVVLLFENINFVVYLQRKIIVDIS